MMIMKKNVVYSYHDFNDDIVESKNQNFELDSSYIYIHHNIFYKLLSFIAYVLSVLFALFYCKLFLHVKYQNKKALKNWRSFYLFANHTQPIGDAFIPALALFPKRPFVLISPANLGIPILGKLLPFMGGLPISDNVHQMNSLIQATKYHLNKKRCIVIYPEAHVWPYYTKIRPFASSAFNFPVSQNVPSFCLTTTYQKSKIYKKPRITVYIDGPFFPDMNLDKKGRIAKLHEDVKNCMEKRSKASNYQYIKYQKIQ